MNNQRNKIGNMISPDGIHSNINNIGHDKFNYAYDNTWTKITIDNNIYNIWEDITINLINELNE